MSELKQLNRELLNSDFIFPKDLTVGKKNRYPVRVLQFGEGNFLRAFVDWMIDVLNSHDLFFGSISTVQPIDRGLVKLINEQDGLYTQFARGIQNGKVTEEKRLITSVKECINPYTNWIDVVSVIKQPEVRFIFSNTTEAGIAYKPEPLHSEKCQETFPAKLTSLLYERYKCFDGNNNKGFIIIPCELIAENGKTLKKYVLKYAEDWKLDKGFKAWIENANYFLSTLVDRIVPGYPANEVERIQDELGYNDKLIDTSEIFHLFVIECPEKLSAELLFTDAGLNVVWTDDMTPYRTQKVRFLNGAHTANVLGAFLGGLDTVGEMMDDEVFGKLVKHIVFNEIMPSLDMDKDIMMSYAGSVLERFKNPFIRHELISISLNSVSKWKVRVMPSLLDYCERNESLPKGIAFSLAALIAFYKGKKVEGKFLGERNEKNYLINDNSDVIDFFDEVWNSGKIDYKDIVEQILGNIDFWDQDLTQIDGLTEFVTSALKNIMVNGVISAIDKCQIM